MVACWVIPGKGSKAPTALLLTPFTEHVAGVLGPSVWSSCDLATLPDHAFVS